MIHLYASKNITAENSLYFLEFGYFHAAMMPLLSKQKKVNRFAMWQSLVQTDYNQSTMFDCL